MIGVVLDITDRKRAEEETARRQAQLAEAQRIARLGSYHWDVATNTVDRSEELCKIFGVRPDEFEPTFDGYLERVHADDRDATQTRDRAGVRRPISFFVRGAHRSPGRIDSVASQPGKMDLRRGERARDARGHLPGHHRTQAGRRPASAQRRALPDRGAGDQRRDLGLGPRYGQPLVEPGHHDVVRLSRRRRRARCHLAIRPHSPE